MPMLSNTIALTLETPLNLPAVLFQQSNISVLPLPDAVIESQCPALQ